MCVWILEKTSPATVYIQTIKKCSVYCELIFIVIKAIIWNKIIVNNNDDIIHLILSIYWVIINIFWEIDMEFSIHKSCRSCHFTHIVYRISPPWKGYQNNWDNTCFHNENRCPVSKWHLLMRRHKDYTTFNFFLCLFINRSSCARSELKVMRGRQTFLQSTTSLLSNEEHEYQQRS